MGENTLKLLAALVKQSDANNTGSRPVNIFYDNAQNIYGRCTPNWSSMGLNMTGRTTVMKESFRSTRPIAEFAVNVLYRLKPHGGDTDHKELNDRGLIEETQRNGHPWWNVRFNQVNGPQPSFKKYNSIPNEIDAIGDQICEWIQIDGVDPSDICVLYIGKNIRRELTDRVGPKLKVAGAKLLVETGMEIGRDQSTVLATTPHSFKGYDAEIIVVAGVDQFIAKNKETHEPEILATTLYVAMTRARSILAVYGLERRPAKPLPIKLLTVLQDCLDSVLDRPDVDKEISKKDEFDDLLAEVGSEHRDWLESIWKFDVQQDPIQTSDGEILGEPVFWFRVKGQTIACSAMAVQERRLGTNWRMRESKSFFLELLFDAAAANF